VKRGSASNRQKPEVKEAHTAQGIYDPVAKVETKSKNQLRETAEEIRRLDHVHSNSAQTIEIHPNGYQVLCFNCNIAKGFMGCAPNKSPKG
jgi:hypothetical protein